MAVSGDTGLSRLGRGASGISWVEARDANILQGTGRPPVSRAAVEEATPRASWQGGSGPLPVGTLIIGTSSVLKPLLTSQP